MQLDLFRIRVFGLGQAHLFRGDVTPSGLLREALITKPTVRSHMGVQWHIGNVDQIDEHGFYFALGRTTRQTYSKIDDATGDFVIDEFPTAPYTHVIADVRLEVCAIARKTSLAPTTATLSRHLARLLNESIPAMDVGGRFEISDLSDPEPFLTALRTAYRVSFFKVTVKRPNPWDMEQDFLKPLSRAVEVTGGDVGEATLKGRDLNTDALEEIVRSATSTGDNASAKLYLDHEARRPVSRSTKGDRASVAVESLDDREARREALAKLRQQYEAVRGKPAG